MQGDTRVHAGIAVYVCQLLTDVRVLSAIASNVHFCRVALPSYKCLLVHRRPSVTAEPEFRRVLRSTVDDFKPDFIVGDVNVNIAPDNDLLSSLLNLQGYQRILHDATTDSRTKIDIAFSRIPECKAFALESVFSFHKPIFIDVSPRHSGADL